MTRSRARRAVVALVAAALVVLLTLHALRDDAPTTPSGAPSSSASASATPDGASPRAEPAAPGRDPRRARARAPRASADGSAPAGPLRVAGRVVSADLAGDDVPVAGARVRRWHTDEIEDILVVDIDASPAPADDETVTDAEGRFAFALNHEDAGWRVSASANGVGVGSAHGTGPEHVTIALDAVVAATLRLVDAVTGAPIAGARVSAWSGDVAGPPDVAVASGADGRVRLDVRIGAELVIVSVGHALTRVTVREGLDGTDVALDPAPAVRGRVVDDTGRGIAGASVLVSLRVASLVALSTDTAGRFVLPRLAADDAFDFTVYADGFGDTSRIVHPGETDVTIVFDRPAFLEVEVVDADGRPADDAEIDDARPLGGGRFEVGPLAPGAHEVEVSRAGPSGDEQGADVVVVHAGDRRRVRIDLTRDEPALAGSVRFRVVVPEGLTLPQSVIELSARDGSGEVGSCGASDAGMSQWTGACEPGAELVARLQLRDEQAPVAPAADVEFVMGSAEAPATVVLQLAPAFRAALELVDAEGAPVVIASSMPHRVVGGGARAVPGGFWIADSATFRVRVEIPGWLPYDAERSAGDVAGGRLRVVLLRGCTVRGRIVIATSHVSERAITVVLEREGADSTTPAPVGRDGVFSIGGLEPGAARLVVRDGGEPIAARPVVAGPAILDLGDIEIPRLVALRGRVEDVRGEPFVGARVLVWNDDVVRSVGSSADGEFAVQVPEGVRVAVRASASDLMSRPVIGYAAEGGAPVVVRLEPEPQVFLRGPGLGRSPQGVRVRPLDGSPAFHVSPGDVARDVVRLDGMSAGRFELTVVWDGRERRVVVDVRPGEVVEVDVERR